MTILAASCQSHRARTARPAWKEWVGGWVGGWVGEWVEEQAVGMSYCMSWVGWVEENEVVRVRCWLYGLGKRVGGRVGRDGPRRIG